MLKRTAWLLASVTLTVLSTLTPISLGSGSAEAAVYCKTAGVPDGCVARPTATAGAPGRVGVAGVGAGAPGARRPRGHSYEPRRAGQPCRPPLERDVFDRIRSASAPLPLAGEVAANWRFATPDRTMRAVNCAGDDG